METTITIIGVGVLSGGPYDILVLSTRGLEDIGVKGPARDGSRLSLRLRNGGSQRRTDCEV